MRQRQESGIRHFEDIFCSAAAVANVYLIVGLGNPGKGYGRTRHNAGFMVVDRLADRWGAGWSTKKRLQARVAEARRDVGLGVLAQPLTFMNASGEAVGALTRFYQVPLDRLLVVVDDADLELGTLRLRPAGSSGGHHGLESVEQHLAGRRFARLRVGIGRASPQLRQITGHVLAAFDRVELPILEKVLVRAAEQAECWLESGLQAAMSRYNGRIE